MMLIMLTTMVILIPQKQVAMQKKGVKAGARICKKIVFLLLFPSYWKSTIGRRKNTIADKDYIYTIISVKIENSVELKKSEFTVKIIMALPIVTTFWNRLKSSVR